MFLIHEETGECNISFKCKSLGVPAQDDSEKMFPLSYVNLKLHKLRRMKFKVFYSPFNVSIVNIVLVFRFSSSARDGASW